MYNIIDQIIKAHESVSNLDWYLRRQHVQDKTEPANDRNASGAIHHLDLGNTARILYGRVVDVIPHCHWYKVQPEGMMTTISCCLLAGTSLNPIGAREITQLAPNTRVYFIMHPSNQYGDIIGAEPFVAGGMDNFLSDYITQTSRCGIQVDNCHRFPFTLGNQGSIIDWSAGRPLDQTSLGEAGWMTETGTSIFLDSAMAFLRADENCGIWAFNDDQALRLAGHNFQLRTAGLEWEMLDDESEFTAIRGVTPYPWEAMGAFDSSTATVQRRKSRAVQFEEQHYGVLEPVHDDQQPFYRLQTYEGYLGQIRKDLLVIPPKSDLKLNRYKDRLIYPGVFENNLSMDGSWSLRSARRVSLAKYPSIPVPKRVVRPEDNLGDSSANYSSAGKYPGGKPHTLADFTYKDPELPHLQRQAYLPDENAYLWNWRNGNVFFYHNKDFLYPDEIDMDFSMATPKYDKLSSKTWLEEPKITKLRVDHRETAASFYHGDCAIDLLEDGGVSITGAGGASIRMVAGSIILSAPGDIQFHAGRNILGFAGRDLVGRARKNVELSSTDKNVRIKAERDCQIVAGNSGVGALLLESKSREDTYESTDKVGDDWHGNGVIIKASNTRAMTIAKNIYLRTGGGDAGAGNIYLDANKGQNIIRSNSRTFERFLTSQAVDYFGTDGKITASNSWSAQSAVISGTVGIDGSVAIKQQLLVGTQIFSTSGHVFTAQAKAYDGRIPELKDQFLDKANEFMAGVVTDPLTNLKKTGGQTYTKITEEWYGNARPGNDAVITHMRFSFRTTKQCKAEDFVLFENYWQQLARLGSVSVDRWTEKQVSAGSEGTYPFPGREAWKEKKNYRQVTWQLFDAKHGISTGRSSPLYSNPTHPAPERVAMDGNYLVIP